MKKENINLEQKKCKNSPYYYATNYLKVNGKPFTTRYSEKEFNRIFSMYEMWFKQ